jgi:ribosomal protein L7/L12
MNCPYCKNPVSNASSLECEWCGSRLYKTGSTELNAEAQPTDLDTELIELIKGSNRMKAIKLYKDEIGCSAKEAKDYIEHLRQEYKTDNAHRATILRETAFEEKKLIKKQKKDVQIGCILIVVIIAISVLITIAIMS